jgi:hypothetical protein
METSTATLRLENCINQTCPWSGDPVQADSLMLFQGQVVGFCNPGCRDKFAKAVSHFEAAAKILPASYTQEPRKNTDSLDCH